MSILKTHQEIIQEFEEKFGVFTVEEEIKSLLTSSTIRILEAEIEALEGMKREVEEMVHPQDPSKAWDIGYNQALSDRQSQLKQEIEEIKKLQ